MEMKDVAMRSVEVNQDIERQKIEHQQEIRRKADIFAALGNPVRLCIVERLIQEGPKNVSEITSCMGVSQPSISQHLRRLKELDIITGEKFQNQVIYTCKRDDIRSIVEGGKKQK